MTFARSSLALLFGGCLLLTISGCATLNFPFVDKDMPKASARNPVTQVVCIWQGSEGRDPSGLPCRGVAGQIIFLAGRGSLPVQVEGDIRVYLFDDQGTEEEQSKPLHQYDFDAVSWNRHLTKGTLGPTYSVFIPYTRRGQMEAEVALRVRFTSEDGQSVFSEMASLTLPGKKLTKPEEESDEVRNKISRTEADSTTQALRRTTTISLDGNPSKVGGQNDSAAAVMARAQEEVSGQVQLASHVESRQSDDASTQRLAELEVMVKQLREQNSANARGGIRQAVATSEDLDIERETDSGPQRVRLVSHAQDEAAPRHRLSVDRATSRHPLEASSDDEANDASPIETVAPPRRLPDEVVRSRRAVTPHPLEVDDEDVAPANTSSDKVRSARLRVTEIDRGESPQSVEENLNELRPHTRIIRATEENFAE